MLPTTTRRMPAARMASVQGGLAARMAAGLQRDIEDRSGRVFPAVRQRRPFRMEAAAPGVPPLADDAPVLDQHGPPPAGWG